MVFFEGPLTLQRCGRRITKREGSVPSLRHSSLNVQVPITAVRNGGVPTAECLCQVHRFEAVSDPYGRDPARGAVASRVSGFKRVRRYADAKRSTRNM